MYVPTVLTQPPTRESETQLAHLAARWVRPSRKSRRFDPPQRVYGTAGDPDGAHSPKPGR